MTATTVETAPYRAFTDLDGVDETTAFWARFLDVVHALPSIRANHRRTVELLGVREGFALLDVGCGAGSFAHDALPLVGATGRVVGIDASEGMVKVARERTRDRAKPIAFHVADASDLPFGDGLFDGCRTERVLQYLADPAAAVAEMTRVTKPGGRVVATEVDWDGMAIDCPEIERDAWRRVVRSISEGVGIGWMGRQVRRLFAEAGLDDVTCEGFVMVVTDAATLFDDLLVRAAIERARDAGAISAEETARLIAGGFAAGRAGRFCGGIPLYTVSGRKPAA